MIHVDDQGRRGVQFIVYSEAQPAGSKRQVPVRRKVDGEWVNTGQFRVIDANVQAQFWKESVAREAARAMNGLPLFQCPLRLDVIFFRPRPKGHFGKRGLLPSAPPYPTTKPDRTKLLRGLEDALTGICWRDDSQVCAGETRKEFGEPARVEVEVQELRAPVQASAEQESLCLG